MLRQGMVLFAVLVMAGSSRGQSSFRWQQGQVLTYRVDQSTMASEVIENKKVDTKTTAQLVKCWQVKNVDNAGVATLHLSLKKLRWENTRPDGEVLLFDSTQIDKSNPALSKELGGLVGPVLAVLRIDSKGKVVEVKESKFGPASRYQSELPLMLTLPDAALKEGLAWERAYQITLEPPQGTGEKYDATQQYRCKSLANGMATITLATSIKGLPESPLDQVPLLLSQPDGEVVFDTKLGMLRSARLVIDKELKDHQGAGSSYHFRSVLSAEYVQGR
jgi:hypothetical protein